MLWNRNLTAMGDFQNGTIDSIPYTVSAIFRTDLMQHCSTRLVLKTLLKES